MAKILALSVPHSQSFVRMRQGVEGASSIIHQELKGLTDQEFAQSFLNEGSEDTLVLIGRRSDLAHMLKEPA